MCCTLPFLLFCSPLLCLSSSMLPYSFRTIICCTTAPFPGTPVPDFPQSLSPYNYIPYTLQTLPLLWVLSTPPYTLPLLLEAAPLPCYAPSPSSTPSTVVPLPLVFSFSYLDTPTSCVPSLYTQNTSPFLQLSLVSSPLVLHTALFCSLALQTYCPPLSSSFVLLHSCTSGQSAQTSHTSYKFFPLSLLVLPLIGQGHAFH